MKIFKWIYWGFLITGAILFPTITYFHLVGKQTIIYLLIACGAFPHFCNLFLTRHAQDWLYEGFIAYLKIGKAPDDHLIRWIKSPVTKWGLRIMSLLGIYGAWLLYKSPM